MTAGNFWDSEVWSGLFLLTLLLGGMMAAHMIKRKIGFLRRSLIPASVLGGIILLAVSTICKVTIGDYIFNLDVFTSGTGFSGIGILEVLTYHGLGIGFVCMALRSQDNKRPRQTRGNDIFNSGVTTVSTYLLQGVLGMGITCVAALFLPDLIEASGILLAFGYGQGTGQALNYGALYETQYGFIGGKSFGLTMAALGFLSASICGVAYLNYLKKKGLIREAGEEESSRMRLMDIQDENEIPLTESLDKLTIQIAIILLIYAVAFGLMLVIGDLAGSGLKATIFGFNFIFGTLCAVLFKQITKFLKKIGWVKHTYINNFMMNRLGGFAFDVMIVAGIGAIQIDLIRQYWSVLLILGVVGAVMTFVYVRWISRVLFPAYQVEQFLAFYGMLTGTVSTGVILLREVDPEFKTPASDNLVYQTFVAIVFGFPILLLASYAPVGSTAAYITMGICMGMFIFFNILLFRKRIFKKREKR